jgi:serine-type D-Ala-D-Ala carboxypeptidase (penicillin-binding protein 5/6)
MRKHKSGKLAAVIACIVFLISLGIGTWNTLRPLPPIAVSQQAVTSNLVSSTPLSWPSGGEAAAETQGISPVLTTGTQKALPTASVAKIITCLTVLQAKPLSTGDLGPTMTLTQADLDLYNNYVAKNGSVIHVAPGEQLTEYQALEALLLPSANNIADSLAIWAFGSMDAYHSAATQYLQQLGLANTTVGSDASGLSPDTTSTPSDLIRLGEQAMANPVIAQIADQTSATLPIEGTVYNVNRLLGQDGIMGIKTGNSDEAGGNLLFAAKTDVAPGKTVTIIGVIMGQDNLNAALDAAIPLLNSIKANLYIATPVRAGQTIATYTAAWGATATAVAKKDLSFVAWKGTVAQPDVHLQKNNLSYTKGAAMGTLAVTAGNVSAGSDIVLTSTIPEPNFWWRLTRH